MRIYLYFSLPLCAVDLIYFRKSRNTSIQVGYFITIIIIIIILLLLYVFKYSIKRFLAVHNIIKLS